MSEEIINYENTTVATVSSEDAMLSMIERVASNPDADIAKMERLMEMRNQEMARVAKQKYYADFSFMQAELPQIEEKADGHNTKYASFENINAAVQPVLSKYGFAISFRISQANNQIIVTALLSHKGGHAETTDISLPHDASGNKNNVQAVGSSTSYGKRYAMCAILNIVTCGEDDNGKSAEVVMATQTQCDVIGKLYRQLTDEQKASFDEKTGGILNIAKADVDKIIAKLNKSIAEKK
jgi:hypothetical protein